MIFHHWRFNIYLAMAVVLTSSVGCKTNAENKKFSVVRLHLEVNRDSTGRSNPVPIYRQRPFMVNVEKNPFITESFVKEARVVDTVGGFAVKLTFERRGAWILEQYTASNLGKRIAVYGEFFDPPSSKTNITRWLAAPIMTKRITDGVFTFTPDATRDEADAFVLGLSKLAKKTEDEIKW